MWLVPKFGKRLFRIVNVTGRDADQYCPVTPGLTLAGGLRRRAISSSSDSMSAGNPVEREGIAGLRNSYGFASPSPSPSIVSAAEGSKWLGTIPGRRSTCLPE